MAAALHGRGVSAEFAYNRKEAKDHGEGGTLVGAPVRRARAGFLRPPTDRAVAAAARARDRLCAQVKGRRVLLVDDVISAGTAVREAAGILQAAGAELVGVCVAVDRQEVTGGAAPPEPGAKRVSAVEGVRRDLGVPVVPILTLTDLLTYLEGEGGASAEHATAVRAYREMYGAV